MDAAIGGRARRARARARARRKGSRGCERSTRRDRPTTGGTTMRIHRLLIALPLASACIASGGHASREPVEAREAYQRAVASSAATEAPKPHADARVALANAEQANRNSPGSDIEKHLAYIAKRRADLAILQADRVATE